MSAENVEVVRQAYEAVTRRPKPDFATVNALYHPDHEFVSMLSGLDGQSLRGAQGAREWLTTLDETWESYAWKLDEVSEIDHDRALVVAAISTRTRRGGVLLKQRLGCVVTVRDGKIARSVTYSSPEEALEAVRREK